jgi:two-component system nitrate/nitrite response regulator NarL
MTSTGAVIRVVVVDDHPFFRDGVTRGLNNSGYIRVVGEAGDGREAIEVIAREQPQVDYQMPDMDGIELVHSLVRDGVKTRVLLLSAVTDSAVVFRALEEGAAGYLSKDATRAEIVDAVVRVANRHDVVPSGLASGLAEQIRLHHSQSDTPILSERERQVLEAFSRGLSIPQTAAELFLGVSTVKTYTQRLYEKLGVSDRAAAVAEAMRRNLLD